MLGEILIALFWAMVKGTILVVCVLGGLEYANNHADD